LDVDRLMRWRALRSGRHTAGEMTFPFYDEEIDLKYEARLADPGDSWLRLKYELYDCDSDEPRRIDDWIRLEASRPHFGGLRRWFRCPRTGRLVAKLYLPLGGWHFRSRKAYRLPYASQREAGEERAERRARKLRRKLGGDPEAEDLPTKPARMRWKT